MLFRSGLDSVSAFNKKANDLYKSEEMKKVLTGKEKISNEEMSQQENFRNNFVLKDLKWWTAEIKILNQTKNKNDERAQMNKRLLSYLSLLAYMNCSADLQQKQFDLLETHLKIYEMAEPSNSEHQYMYAELSVVKKEDKKVFSYLDKAVKLGFMDISRLESDSLFSDFRKTHEYPKLLEKFKIDFQF